MRRCDSKICGGASGSRRNASSAFGGAQNSPGDSESAYPTKPHESRNATRRLGANIWTAFLCVINTAVKAGDAAGAPRRSVILAVQDKGATYASIAGTGLAGRFDLARADSYTLVIVELESAR